MQKTIDPGVCDLEGESTLCPTSFALIIPLTPNSRSYLNQFTQPDSIIPQPNNPQSWNRYEYAEDNPINNTDPTGHCNIMFSLDISFAMSCVNDLADAFSSYQAGNHNPVGVALIASGVTRAISDATNAVNQWNSDTATVLSNAPAI